MNNGSFSNALPWRLRHYFSSRLGVLPNFIIAGFPKCGTTSLFEYLSAHPDIYAPLRKEIWYFSGRRYDEDPHHLQWYKGHFPSILRKAYVEGVRREKFLTGEASPDYLTYHPEALTRMKSLVPNASLVILMRDPVDRTYSYFQHERRSGREKRRFSEVLDAEIDALSQARGRVLYTNELYKDRHQRDSYLITSLYVNYLERLFSIWSGEKILVVKSEDMFSQPVKTFHDILEFLGLGYVDCGEGLVHNKGRYDAPKNPELVRLSEYVAPFNERLYQLIGRDMGWGVPEATRAHGMSE